MNNTCPQLLCLVSEIPENGEEVNTYFHSHGMPTTTITRALPHDSIDIAYYVHTEGEPSSPFSFIKDGIEYNNIVLKIGDEWILRICMKKSAEAIVEEANAYFHSHGMPTTTVTRALPHDSYEGAYYTHIEGGPSRPPFPFVRDGVEYNNVILKVGDTWMLKFVC